MDFDTGRRELDSMADEEAARYKRPTTFIGKVRMRRLRSEWVAA